jgi:hypothetical protein
VMTVELGQRATAHTMRTHQCTGNPNDTVRPSVLHDCWIFRSLYRPTGLAAGTRAV